MEKICIIGAEVCAVILSVLCAYHYFANNCDDVVVFFSLMFAGMAVWCHKVQKDVETDFKSW